MSRNRNQAKSLMVMIERLSQEFGTDMTLGQIEATLKQELEPKLEIGFSHVGGAIEVTWTNVGGNMRRPQRFTVEHEDHSHPVSVKLEAGKTHSQRMPAGYHGRFSVHKNGKPIASEVFARYEISVGKPSWEYHDGRNQVRLDLTNIGGPMKATYDLRVKQMGKVILTDSVRLDAKASTSVFFDAAPGSIEVWVHGNIPRTMTVPERVIKGNVSGKPCIAEVCIGCSLNNGDEPVHTDARPPWGWYVPTSAVPTGPNLPLVG